MRPLLRAANTGTDVQSRFEAKGISPEGNWARLCAWPLEFRRPTCPHPVWRFAPASCAIDVRELGHIGSDRHAYPARDTFSSGPENSGRCGHAALQAQRACVPSRIRAVGSEIDLVPCETLGGLSSRRARDQPSDRSLRFHGLVASCKPEITPPRSFSGWKITDHGSSGSFPAPSRLRHVHPIPHGRYETPIVRAADDCLALRKPVPRESVDGSD